MFVMALRGPRNRTSVHIGVGCLQHYWQDARLRPSVLLITRLRAGLTAASSSVRRKTIGKPAWLSRPRTCLALIASLAGTLATGTSAHGAFPGATGRIAFGSEGEIFSVRPHGTGLTSLTRNSAGGDSEWLTAQSRLVLLRIGTEPAGPR